MAIRTPRVRISEVTISGAVISEETSKHGEEGLGDGEDGGCGSEDGFGDGGDERWRWRPFSAVPV